MGNGSLFWGAAAQLRKGRLILGSMVSNRCPQEVTSEGRTRDFFFTSTTDLPQDSSRPIVSFNQYNFPGFVLFLLYKGRRIPRVCVTYPKQLHKLCRWPSNSSESALSGHKAPSSVAPRGAGGWAWGWLCGSLRVSQLQAWSPLHIYVFLTPNPAMQDSRSPSHGKLYTSPQPCSYPGGGKP